MASPNEVDLQAFLTSLTYHVDERKDPDDARRRQFRMRWQRAVQRQEMAAATLATSFTWNNLGLRAGKFFGSKSDASVDMTVDGFAAIFRREKSG